MLKSGKRRLWPALVPLPFLRHSTKPGIYSPLWFNRLLVFEAAPDSSSSSSECEAAHQHLPTASPSPWPAHGAAGDRHVEARKEQKQELVAAVAVAVARAHEVRAALPPAASHSACRGPCAGALGFPRHVPGMDAAGASSGAAVGEEFAVISGPAAPGKKAAEQGFAASVLGSCFPIVESKYAVLREVGVGAGRERGVGGGGRGDGGCYGARGGAVAGKLSMVSGTVSSVRGRISGVVECNSNGFADSCRKKKKKNKKRQGMKPGEGLQAELQPKDAEQRKAVEDFLCQLLPEDFELGVEVVRDVLGQCEGDVQQALNMLLEMAAPSCRCDSPRSDEGLSVINSESGSLKALLAAFSNLDPAKVVIAYQEADSDFELAADFLLQAGCQEDSANKPLDSFGQAEEENPSLNVLLNFNTHSLSLFRPSVLFQICAQVTSNCGRFVVKILVSWLQKTFPSVEGEILFQVLKANDYCYRKTVDFLVEGGVKPSEDRQQDSASLLTSVMQTLFKRETKTSPPPSPPPARMNRGNDWQVVKPRSPRDELFKNGRVERIEDDEQYDAYKVCRRLAAADLAKMNECFQQASAAYQRGERAYAGILSERGKEYQKSFRDANDKASTHLFNVKNKYMDNNITIDLHAQHVKEAMHLLKLHINSLSPLPSVHTLTIITGHGNGQAKIKPSVTRYLEKRGIGWEDHNLGRLVVNLEKLRAKADPLSQA